MLHLKCLCKGRSWGCHKLITDEDYLYFKFFASLLASWGTQDIYGPSEPQALWVIADSVRGD